VQHLSSNTIDPVARVTISTIQRVYSILRGEPDLDPELDEHSAYELATEPVPVEYNAAGQIGIVGGQLKTVPVPVPPLAEQRRIVADVEERLGRTDVLRAAIERPQRRSAALRRSVLKRAFHGEFVPQDPSDEPASVLLDRIRAGRAAEVVV